MYDWLCQNIDHCFVCEKVLKETSRGRVERLRHRESGQRVICRRFSGNAEVYQKLLSVSSENLPKVLAAEERDGQVIVLEEYISGDTLDALLREGRMNETETREIAGGVCSALWVLHSLGAVHRDVKPENIILSGSRTVLIDFDAARLQRDGAGTDTQILGTMGYAAPEQFGLAQSDARTDIYAVGVLINVMLTGEHPSKQLASGRLRHIITRCTQISPEKRYPDIPHLMEALQPARMERRTMHMKHCPNCGAELPDQATLCPNCMADLADRSQMVPPRGRRRGWIPGAALGAVVLAGILLAVLLPRGGATEPPDSGEKPPVLEDHTAAERTEAPVSAEDSTPVIESAAEPAEAEEEGTIYDDGSAALTYEDGGEIFTLLAHFSYSLDRPCREPEPEFSVALEQGGATDTLTMVTVVDSEGVSAAQTFREKVADVRLEAVNPEDNPGALTVKEWGVNENFTQATYTGGLRMNGADCDTGVAWIITMKNGDTLVLRQTIHLTALQKTVYHEANADLSDIDALNALLEKIETELPPDRIVDIYLPPVRYEGGLNLVNHAVNLYGSNEGDAVTTFTGTVTVTTRDPVLPEFYGLHFEGSGGTGLYATSPVNLHECVFTGWDTAAYMGDGSFILPMGCTFADNGIGLHMDSVNSTASSNTLPDNTFTGNGTALLIEGIPMSEPLGFMNCVFRQNTVDIENPSGHALDPSGAKFE